MAAGTTLLQMRNGATIRTLPGGTFDFQSDGMILGASSFDPAPERFLNEGYTSTEHLRSIRADVEVIWNES